MPDTQQHDGWRRLRFRANYDDPRPIVHPPPGPYWITGFAADESHATIVAYLPHGMAVTDWWPEASEVESEDVDGFEFSGRFPRPDWWPASDG